MSLYDDDIIEMKDRYYRIFLYFATGIVAGAGLYVAWLYVSNHRDIGFIIEWKFWKSTILWPTLSVIGFFLQFLDWEHTSFSEGWFVKDSWGREKWVENNDIISVLWGNCLFPLIAHFFLIPCIYGAILYYIIIAPLALVNAFIPYIAAAVCIFIPVLFYIISRNFDKMSYSFVRLVGVMVIFLFAVGLLYLPTTYDFSSHKKEITSSEIKRKTIGEITIKTQMANLRTGPGANYAICTRLDGTKVQAHKGERFEVLELKGKWYKVLLSDGTEAFIKKSLCKKMISYSTTKGEDATLKKDSIGRIPKSQNRVGKNQYYY